MNVVNEMQFYGAPKHSSTVLQSNEFKKEEIDQSITHRFEQLVAMYPNNIAVKDHRFSLTYDSLNRAANRIARAILSKSDDKNEPVAVLVENDSLTITMILGLLKAGKIYVPIDASFSRDWANSILEDTQAKIILVNDNLQLAEEWKSTHTVIDTQDLEQIYREENLGIEIAPSALAYILYTSGSTGRPKGVPDSHRNMLHHVMNMTNMTRISVHDRMTLLRPPSSSGALSNAFSALLNGGSIFPVKFKAIDFKGLAEWLIRERITFFHAGSVVFRHFAALLTGKERFPDLRLLRLSSGRLSKVDVDLFKQCFPDCILVHALSSTETNTYRMYFFDKNSQMPDATLPVGYPVPGKDVLILDEAGNRLPPETLGEIAVRSSYLFSGYWRNPELTRSVFFPDPGAGDQRIFRTGDLGLLRPDGCLEYVGRKDFRLKIRGHTIQAEEVEMALLQIPGIQQAAVISRRDKHGDDRLVSYVAFAQGSATSVSQLRALLKARLPDYMLPAIIVRLNALKLGPNGKIDRQALPPPPNARPELDTDYIPPRTPIQAMLVGMWSELLEIDEVGIEDDFFELGGDSLLASRAVALVNSTLSCNLAPSFLFETHNIIHLSQRLVESERIPGEVNKIASIILQVDEMTPEKIRQILDNECKSL